MENVSKRKWYDFFIFPMLGAFIIIVVSQMIGDPPMRLLGSLLGYPEDDPYFAVVSFYGNFLFLWLTVLAVCFFIKSNRPILKAITPFCKGNNVRNLLLGLLIGFVQNGLCILVAYLNKDIILYFDSVQFLRLIVIFILVFIQSSSEELLCRAYLYQKFRKTYKHPAFAIIGNAMFFMIIHIFNSGVTITALLSITLIGILYALMVYYFDSIWMPMAAHAAWNFTQNIIFGLPNSGNVFDISIFKLDAASARDSFAYNVGFGVESSIFAIAVILVSIAIVICIGRKKNSKPTEIWE